MKKLLFTAFWITILIVFNACQKHSFTEKKNDAHSVNSMDDLIVSDQFMWKTTKDIHVIIDLPADYQNFLPLTIADESGERMFFTGNPEKDDTRLITNITIPSYITQLKLIFPAGSGKPDVNVALTGNNLLYDLTRNGTKSVQVPCDLSGFLTYSQGGWGAPAQGSNPGAVRDAYFSAVFPTGVDVGDPSNFTIHFSSASAIESFLPVGGTDNPLTQNLTDPANGNGLGTWAGQIVAAVLNVSYDEAGYLGSGYTDLKNLEFITGPFAGTTIEDFLIIANTALGGGSASGYSYNQIGYAAEQINLAFDGFNHNFFTCSSSGSGGSGGGGGGGGTPTVTQFDGFLAFEDLWPWKGDYDFNALVIDYDFDITKNSQEYIQHIKATFTIYAIGAFFNNGFGFSLPNVQPSAIVNATGSVLKANSVITLANNGLEAGQTSATIIVNDDLFDVMPHPGNGIGVNTEIYSPYVQPATIVIDMDFVPGTVTFNQLDIGHFNPFIFIDQNRSVEIHLPGYAPTSLADVSLIGTGEDTGNQGATRYYKTNNNLPWAINIPEEFDYPIEKHDITTVYTHFAQWAESDGVDYADWYKDLPGYRNQSSIYTHN
jgi:LruC domain-containing protein